jgi:hypothetical protein
MIKEENKQNIVQVVVDKLEIGFRLSEKRPLHDIEKELINALEGIDTYLDTTEVSLIFQTRRKR